MNLPRLAKFRIPRCADMFRSKEFEKCWRPQLHCVCVICHGVVECFFIMDGDLPKNSSMNITLINRAVDVALDVLRSRNVSAPHHLCLQADNTAREQRNQFVFSFCALATAKHLWATVTQCFYRPGHSHNEVDQRFVGVAAALSRATQLQNCEEPLDLNFQ